MITCIMATLLLVNRLANPVQTVNVQHRQAVAVAAVVLVATVPPLVVHVHAAYSEGGDNED